MDAHEIDAVEQVANPCLGLGSFPESTQPPRVQPPQHRQSGGVDEHECRDHHDPRWGGRIYGSQGCHSHADRAGSPRGEVGHPLFGHRHQSRRHRHADQGYSDDEWERDELPRAEQGCLYVKEPDCRKGGPRTPLQADQTEGEDQ